MIELAVKLPREVTACEKAQAPAEMKVMVPVVAEEMVLVHRLRKETGVLLAVIILLATLTRLPFMWM